GGGTWCLEIKASSEDNRRAQGQNTKFAEVICQDYDESLYRPSIAVTVDVLSDDQKSIVDTCVDAFNREVNNSDTLINLFDLRPSPALEAASYAYDAFVGVLTTLGAEDPKTIGVLTQENADLLGSQFTLFFEDSSRKYVKEGDPTSKFPAITEGIVVFLKSIGPLTYEEGLTVSISYESEWLLKAVETPYSTKLFYRCSFEADGDPN
ncbi:uncharacterized protein NPIL_323741, partial [Nephila pilipes]